MNSMVSNDQIELAFIASSLKMVLSQLPNVGVKAEKTESGWFVHFPAGAGGKLQIKCCLSNGGVDNYCWKLKYTHFATLPIQLSFIG